MDLYAKTMKLAVVTAKRAGNHYSDTLPVAYVAQEQHDGRVLVTIQHGMCPPAVKFSVTLEQLRDLAAVLQTFLQQKQENPA